VKEVALDRDFSLFQASIAATTVAGTICNIITNPIWVVRTRLMTQYLHHEDNHYKTDAPFKVIREMYDKVLGSA
jgi:solute carrier family 25 (mitochondrial folate transporter), member 32